MKRSRGFTLVEVVIATSVSSAVTPIRVASSPST